MLPRRLSIQLTHRILAIGAVGALGLSGLIGLQIYETSKIEHFRVAEDRAQRMSDNVSQFSESVLQSVRAEKSFVIRSELAFTERYAEAAESAAGALAALRKAADGVDTQTRKDLDGLEAGFKKYTDAFASLITHKQALGLTNNSGLEGALRNSAQSLEKKLEELGHTQLRLLMQTMRRHEKDFMMHRAPTHSEQLHAAARDAREMIVVSDLSDKDTKAIEELLGAYERDFKAWAQTVGEVDADQNTAHSAYVGMERILIAFEQRLRKEHNLAAAEGDRIRAAAQRELLIVGGMVLVLVILLAFAIGRSISKPLAALTACMHKVAKDDLDVKVPGLQRHDELGGIAQAVEHFRLLAEERHRLESEQAQARAREEERRATLEREVLRFRSEVGQVMGALDTQTHRMTGMSKALAEAASSTTEKAQSATSATLGAADNSQAVAAASEQLGISIREIAAQAHRASTIVSETTNETRKTNEQLAGLATAAESIGSIVQIIKSVAEQTNLLALNATIEAARAGEAGKGFAVVATEVKALAAQTAKATDEISAQISEVQRNSVASVNAVKAIGARIDEINGLTGSIAAAVEEQEAATHEIAQNVTSAANNSRTAAKDVAGVQTAADQTRGEVEAIAQTSNTLSEVAKRIGTSFDEFVKAIGNDIAGHRKVEHQPVNRPPTAGLGFDTPLSTVPQIGKTALSLPKIAA